ncbi:MAG: PIN domain-containing protein [Myxococcota bacterium]
MVALADVRAVVDATAVLAAVLDEPGGERAKAAIRRRAVMSAANLAETLGKLRLKHPAVDVADVFAIPGLQFRPFDVQDARRVGDLATKAPGVSLADRAALALAQRLRLPLVTADHEWADLDVDVVLTYFRERKQKK